MDPKMFESPSETRRHVANRKAAKTSAPTAACPFCFGHHEVRQNWTQATRQEPCQFLGLQVYCPVGDVSCVIDPLAVEWKK